MTSAVRRLPKLVDPEMVYLLQMQLWILVREVHVRGARTSSGICFA